MTGSVAFCVLVQVYPNVGLHFAACAKLESCRDGASPHKALEFVNSAVRSLRPCLPDSKVLQEMMRMQYELQRHLSDRRCA